MTDTISHSDEMHEAMPAAASPQGLVDHAKLAMIAVDRTSMPMVVTDPNQHDNPIILANAAFLAMTGYAANEVLGRNCRFLQGQKTAPIDVEVIRDAIKRRVEVTHEILNYRKDGSSFWNQLHVSPILDDSGYLIYYFGSNRDASLSRRVLDLERAEHAMLREIDHRAMNALALVQSIVRLTRADDCARYSRAVQGRVDALANAHRLLSLGNWGAVPLDALLCSELASVAATQVHLSGPAIDVDVADVQPLALVLHEIIGNAVDHGALSAPAGTLDIRWRRNADCLSIEFAELGGPAPVPPIGRSYGLTIADAIVAKQLYGLLKRDWHSTGLVTQMTLPNAGGSTSS